LVNHITNTARKNVLLFKGKSHSLSSQAARFFSLAKGKRIMVEGLMGEGKLAERIMARGK
jgi:hypothetical protein